MKKTILFTGSTDGIGKLAAIKLAKDDHQVVIHGRSPEKVERVVNEINKISGQEILGFACDLSDLSSIPNFANEISSSLSSLDVLINNAGVFKSPKSLTGEGLDIRFAVNYFAPYILTDLLLPLLLESPNPRIINLSSAAQSPVDLDALKGNKQLSAQESYAQSKLALTMWSTFLSREQKGITTIPVNPGSLLNTNMVKEAYGRYWSSADKGGNILYELAVMEEYNRHSGEYFDNDRGTERGSFSTAHPDAYDMDKIEELMKITNEVLKI